MGETIVDLAGTPAGERLALVLALVSAAAHALFGAINKTGGDPYLNRGAINLWYAAIAAPIALWATPWPSPELWAVIGASFAVHLVYEQLQATSFHRGAFTLVYPIARGVGPLATAGLALAVFGEWLALGQWAGMALLSSAIMGLALVNLTALERGSPARSALGGAVAAALGTGVMIAVYTIVDAYGMRLAADPFTFLAWFFTLGAFGSPVVAAIRWRRLPQKPPLAPIVRRGLLGALVAFVSFGAVMLATRLDKVGEAAALRETSIVFAAVIGVVWFGERLDARRLGLIGLIVLGAVLVEFGDAL